MQPDDKFLPVRSKQQALGNILMQMVALGKLKNISERELVRQSFPVEELDTPQNVAAWNDAYERYLRVISELIDEHHAK